MSGIDEVLDELREVAIPPRLMAIDVAVLSELAKRRSNAAPLSGGVIGFAVVAALGMGFAGSLVPGTRAEAAPGRSPFGAPSALAPSSLLDSS